MNESMRLPCNGGEENANEHSSEWQRAIESHEFIGPPEDLSVLFEEFSDVEIRKLRNMSIHHKVQIRRVKKDGCCFYRGYMFGLFEHFVKNKGEIDTFKYRLRGELLSKIKEAGYCMSTIDEFIQEALSNLELLRDRSSSSCTVEDVFNDASKSNYIVVFARLLTASHMKLNAPLYEPFLTNYETVEDYCKHEVDPMWVEAEQLQVTALTSILDMPVEILYIDQSPGNQPIRHVFPESPKPKVHLIYRPGHYDVVYP